MLKQQKVICSKCTRVFGNQGAFSRHEEECTVKPGDKEKILELYQNGASRDELKRLGFNPKFIMYVLKGKIRTRSEVNKLNYKSHPESFKHTEEQKQHLSIKRKEWLKNNKDKHNWRFNYESFPEKAAREWLETSFTDKIIAEYTPDDFDKNYKIDFAFINDKIAIEINGNQHYDKQGKLFEYYELREQYLISKGWKVINIPAINILKDFENVKLTILNALNKKVIPCFNKILTKKALDDHILNENKDEIINSCMTTSTINDITKKFKITKRHLKKFLKSNNIKIERPSFSGSVKNKYETIDNLNKEMQTRFEDIKNIDLSKRGTIAYLSEKWNITHTQVRRFLRSQDKLKERYGVQ